MINLDAANQFIAGHARLIDRRRFALLVGDGDAEAVVRALEAYRNADGGIGYLEPDLRAPTSQPSPLLYALEILHEVGTGDLSLARAGLDWLQTVTRSDGGVPNLLPTAIGWPHAPWYAPEPPEDDPPSSLLMTAAIAAAALRLGIEHAWIGPAMAFCWAQADQANLDSAYTLRYLLDFLDTAPDRARAEALLETVRARIPSDGHIGVQGGAEGEVMRPLELAPRPDHVARRLFADGVIERELDQLADAQEPDGGWTFTWAAWNPAVAWEWRGAVTVAAVRTLAAYGVIALPRG